MLINDHQQVAVSRYVRNVWRGLLLGCLALGCVTLPGCGSAAYQSAPVNADLARDVLKDVMDAWKGGDTPEELQAQTPPIIVQDFDWLGGATLVSYEVLTEDKAVDANLVAKVKLTLKDKQGAQTEKTVTYLVGTAPKMTVFRDSFQ